MKPLLLAAALTVTANVFAQQNVDKPKGLIDWNVAQQRAAQAAPTSSATSSGTGSTAIQKAYENYTIHALQQRGAAFDWQMTTSRWIFYMVVLLVVSGLVFSAIQFVIGSRRHDPAATDELELSLQGVKVRSQFLGVVTLTLSLAFFYLYLTTVYPIVEVGTTITAGQKK